MNHNTDIDAGRHARDCQQEAPCAPCRRRAARRRAADMALTWDAGWCAGVSRFTQPDEPPKDNPYRVTPPGETA